MHVQQAASRLKSAPKKNSLRIKRGRFGLESNGLAMFSNAVAFWHTTCGTFVQGLHRYRGLALSTKQAGLNPPPYEAALLKLTYDFSDSPNF
jgi:hypothetical protein